MLIPEAPTVLTIWTLGVEVERCLCRDWPSPPGMGKRNAEAGDKRSILHSFQTKYCTLSDLEWPSTWSAATADETHPGGSGVKAKLLCEGEFSGVRICGYSSVQVLESPLGMGKMCSAEIRANIQQCVQVLTANGEGRCHWKINEVTLDQNKTTIIFSENVTFLYIFWGENCRRK